MKPVTRIAWQRGDENAVDPDLLLTREWLVTNGLGGYASGTISGAPTRRYHGLLVAALPQPLGRTVMLNQLSEYVIFPDGSHADLGAYERSDKLELLATHYLREFRLEQGLPIWTFDFGAYVIEKRLLFAHLQNTVFIQYRMLQGEGSIRLRLRPAVHFRPHEDAVSTGLDATYWLNVSEERFEITTAAFPPLRLRMLGEGRTFVCDHRREKHIVYRVEAERGYSASGELWSLGHFSVRLSREHSASLVASTESWEDVSALTPEEALQLERERRDHLMAITELAESDVRGRELVLAADQFLFSPRGRVAASTRAHARGEDLRTVIAGYHWFTDWGRDTMISFEGLLLQTRRYQEARYVLHTFAQYVHDGLIPNMFPERSAGGVYHTADATLWFFHAIDRYVTYTQDRHLLRELLPVLQDIVAWHVRGTHFGIVVDGRDGLLRQGAPGYQLTWMDAKCDGWVVTPRRGKAVEINALWYNALCNLAGWLHEEKQAEASATISGYASRAEAAFNARFFYADEQYLYDVVDGEDGRDDPALRPNQVFAISLPHPVLRRERWKPVLDAVTKALLTPVGLRSLSPNHPDYKPNYHGDLRTRDAAYHQGTVWSWLIGPYIDAWLKVHPEERAKARASLQGLFDHLGEAGLGSVSEVFDAEPPFTARGCIAQAWGVGELLRAWHLTTDTSSHDPSREPSRKNTDRE